MFADSNAVVTLQASVSHPEIMVQHLKCLLFYYIVLFSFLLFCYIFFSAKRFYNCRINSHNHRCNMMPNWKQISHIISFGYNSLRFLLAFISNAFFTLGGFFVWLLFFFARFISIGHSNPVRFIFRIPKHKTDLLTTTISNTFLACESRHSVRLLPSPITSPYFFEIQSERINIYILLTRL